VNFKNVLILTQSIIKLQRIKISPKNRSQFLIILIFNSFLAVVKAQNTTKNEEVNDAAKKKDTLAKKEALESVLKKNADVVRNDIPKKMTYLNNCNYSN